jgi:hypothetical protein
LPSGSFTSIPHSQHHPSTPNPSSLAPNQSTSADTSVGHPAPRNTPRPRRSKSNAGNKSSVARVLAEGGHGGDKINPVEANLSELSHLFEKLRRYPSI